jgi:hypothetical protein
VRGMAPWVVRATLEDPTSKNGGKNSHATDVVMLRTAAALLTLVGSAIAKASGVASAEGPERHIVRRVRPVGFPSLVVVRRDQRPQEAEIS